MTEIIFRKRKALPGEVGLFLDTEVFREEFSSLPMDAEVKAECTVPANLKYLKYFWGLATKVGANSPDGFLDKQDCADRLLLEARHAKFVHDNLRNKTEIKPKSISGLSADTWIRLLRRVTDVVVMKFLPGMDRNVLKAEIEAMVGVTATDPEPKPRRASRSTARKPADDGPATAKGVQPDEVSDGLSSVAPADSPPPEGRPEGPTNEESYIAACRSWIKKQEATHEDARAYFEGEHHVALRQKCGVKIGVRNMLRRELADKYESAK